MNAAALQKLLTASRSTGTINLANKNLTAVPLELFRLEALEYDNKRWWEEAELAKLDLSHNQLTVLPPDVVRLGCLQSIFVCDNQLTALPETLFTSPSINRVVAYQNRITQLPSLSAATALTDLNVAQNQLTSIPSLAGLRGLTSLNFSANSLTDLPWQGWETLTLLRSLQCSRNRLSKIPPGIAQLPVLNDLDLSFNSLQSIPTLRLPALTRLDLAHNRFVVPPELAALPQLAELHLGYNQLTAFPTIPTPNALSMVDVRDNRLTEVDEAVHLHKLKRLDITNNDISNLPAGLALIKSINALELAGNPMRAIRRDIVAKGTLAILEYLRTRLGQDPDVRPSVSDAVAVLKYKGCVDLSKKGLTDVPTTALQPDPNVLGLLLAGNRLTLLPADIGNLSSLTTLDLSDNLLGSLPLELANLRSLKCLRCANNKLKGPLPVVVYQLRSLTELDCRVNQLTTLGEDVVQLRQLEELRLSHNQLSVLPAGLYQCPALRVLEVANNQLLEVDVAITNLQALNVLDLANNTLARVPFEIGRMTSIRQLSLQGNVLKTIQRSVLDKPTEAQLTYLRNKLPP